MALHLIKMAAGISSLQELEDRQNYLLSKGRRNGTQQQELIHVTRFTPKRADEILQPTTPSTPKLSSQDERSVIEDPMSKVPGSLYWVFQKRIQARQKISEFREMPSEEGITKCGIVLEGPLVPVQMMPKKAFQGWRYLLPSDAPVDSLSGAKLNEEISPAMQADLIELCLL